MIPRSIQRMHILKALRRLSKRSAIPARRSSRRYDLVYRGKAYPPKYVVAVAYSFTNSSGQLLRGFKGGQETNDFLKSRRFKIICLKPAKVSPKRGKTRPGQTTLIPTNRRYRVVSPNVRHTENTVSQWRQAIVAHQASFMGYPPWDKAHKQMGYKFAHVIREDDIILVARRCNGEPEIVGFGRVSGTFKTRLSGFAPPESFGSLRELSPFVPLSAVPEMIDIAHILLHTTALRQLHPDRDTVEQRICDWMEGELRKRDKRNRAQGPFPLRKQVRLAKFIQEHQLEYEFRTRQKIARATKTEASLLIRYKQWIEDQDRTLCIVRYQKLRCDAYEEKRNNLIEAKCSANHEYLRMAVDELLDYAYLGKDQFGEPHKAILLPKKPDRRCEEWLLHLDINVIWEEQSAFLDNANGRFT